MFLPLVSNRTFAGTRTEFDKIHSKDGPRVAEVYTDRKGRLRTDQRTLLYPDGARVETDVTGNYPVLWEPPEDRRERGRRVLDYWLSRVHWEEDAFNRLKDHVAKTGTVDAAILKDLGILNSHDAGFFARGLKVENGRVVPSDVNPRTYALKLLGDQQRTVLDCREKLRQAREAVEGTPAEQAARRQRVEGAAYKGGPVPGDPELMKRLQKYTI